MPHKNNEIARDYLREYRKHKKEKGLCEQCPNPVSFFGAAYCLQCKLKRMNRKNAKRSAKV
jgi:hypothetical protein